MKKSLVALAALAAAGIASAQSSVTLFGVVDASLTLGRGSLTDRTQITDSGYNSSRLGFRGTEDLGGGLAASFWLEAGVNNDNGEGDATNVNNQATGTGAASAGRTGLIFNRRSTLSLSGGFGEVRIGRDYTPAFWNLTIFDPFGTNGVGTTLTTNAFQGATGVRASNSVGYFLPGNLGGFYGQAQYFLGENPEDGTAAQRAVEDDGRGYGLRLGYAAGPLNVAFSFQNTDYSTGDIRLMSLGGQWDFGFAKLMGQLVRDRVDGVAGGRDLDGTGWLLGALVPVGAGEIRLSFSQYENDAVAGALVTEPRARKLALGYVHNLSKRTALYATAARVRNSNGSAVAIGGATTGVNSNSTGFDFGVRHSF